MGMKRRILKGAGFLAAPKLAFAFSHPRKAAMVKATTWAMSQIPTRRRRASARMTAAKGLGAAAIALPVGMWLGRRFMTPQAAEEM
jgi:hypothetical protein